MARRIRDYVKYTPGELSKYTETKGSSMKKINTDLHLNLPPSGMGDLKKSITNLIADKKIGLYDRRLQGIILDVRNIKVVGNVGAMRFDDPLIHLDIRADCYYFQPTIGSVVRGVVRHISSRQIGVIIYRVFSVTIRLNENQNQKQLLGVEMNSEIEFRIKKFDLENLVPYIEGELVAREVKAIKKEFTDEDVDDEEGEGVAAEHEIEEKVTDGNSSSNLDDKKPSINQDDLDELCLLIKEEKEEKQMSLLNGVKMCTPLKSILKKSSSASPSPEMETPVQNGTAKKKKRKGLILDLDESITNLIAKVKKERESGNESDTTAHKAKKKRVNGT